MNKRVLSFIALGLLLPGVAFAATVASGALGSFCLPGCPFCP